MPENNEDENKKEKLHFRWKLDEGETMKSLIVDNYLNHYRENKARISEKMDAMPARIKSSRYYNGKVWAVMGIITVFGVILIFAQTNLSSKESELAGIQSQIEAVKQEQSENKTYIFTKDSLGDAEEAMNKVVELQNKMQGTDIWEDYTGDLKKYLGGHAVGDAYPWGDKYGSGHTWSGYINHMSVDEDIVEIIFILYSDSTKKPVRYIFCDYSVSENVIVSRTERDVIVQ